jgi:hypothetical protein
MIGLPFLVGGLMAASGASISPAAAQDRRGK